MNYCVYVFGVQPAYHDVADAMIMAEYVLQTERGLIFLPQDLV